jgi:predicted HTH transcriptional regulator
LTSNFSGLHCNVCKLKPNHLKTLNIATDYQGHQVPTVGGVLLLCFKREKYFPDGWIQVGKFEGEDRCYVLDTNEFRSYPIIAIKGLLQSEKMLLSRGIQKKEMLLKKVLCF